MAGRNNAFTAGIKHRVNRPQSEYVPPCPHYPAGCVGCPFIDLPYLEQLKRKQRILAEALTAYPTLSDLEVPSVVSSPRRLGYRARVKLVAPRY